MIYYIIITLFSFLLIFSIILILLKNKINKLEKKILKHIKEKNNLIPSLYETTKNILNKHNEIFKEILILRNKDFVESIYLKSLKEKSKTHKEIDKEINFIFKTCSKHPKLEKKAKFTLIKENILSKNIYIGNKMKQYIKLINKFNNFIFIKNILIIGLFIPINKIKKIKLYL